MISAERIMIVQGLDISPSLESRIYRNGKDIIVDIGGQWVNVSKDKAVSKREIGALVEPTPKNVYDSLSGQIISGIFPYNKKLQLEYMNWLEKRGVDVHKLFRSKRTYDNKGYFTVVNHFNEVKGEVWRLLNT